MHELTRVLSQALKWISAVSCLHAASASSVSTSISQSRTDMNRSSSVYIYLLIYVRWESMQWVEYKSALMDWWETYSDIWPWHMNGINQKEPHSIYLIPQASIHLYIYIYAYTSACASENQICACTTPNPNRTCLIHLTIRCGPKFWAASVGGMWACFSPSYLSHLLNLSYLVSYLPPSLPACLPTYLPTSTSLPACLMYSQISNSPPPITTPPTVFCCFLWGVIF